MSRQQLSGLFEKYFLSRKVIFTSYYQYLTKEVRYSEILA